MLHKRQSYSRALRLLVGLLNSDHTDVQGTAALGKLAFDKPCIAALFDNAACMPSCKGS